MKSARRPSYSRIPVIDQVAHLYRGCTRYIAEQQMKKAFLLIMILPLAGCPYTFEYSIIITDYPVNLNGLNTEFDDYNSDIPYPAERMEIYFSTNRGIGHDFNIVAEKMDFSYHSEDDLLDVRIANDVPSRASAMILSRVNNARDEFGPFTYFSDRDMLMLFATESDDTFDIKFVELTNWSYSRDNVVSEPMNVNINQYGDNLYPCISTDRVELFFCSNRNDTVFNIYSARYSSEITKQLLLSDGGIIEKENDLSGMFNDKCPYITDDIIVFASDRPGGSGGYDLWYSRSENHAWINPINFGPAINSEYDDFRPVIFQLLGFDLMIFSSNRPEGKGGFDLYIVNIGDFIN
jgi:hypothetical protein